MEAVRKEKNQREKETKMEGRRHDELERKKNK